MIVGFIGGIGSGKTLSMTRQLYRDHLEGKKIYSNYKLMFGRGSRIEYLDKEFFKNYKPENFEMQSASVGFDEAHVFIDSRTSMSGRNKMFSRFITQSRKRDVNLYYTTQEEGIESFRSSGQVDLRLRKLTDMLVFCTYIRLGGNHYVYQDIYFNGKNTKKVLCLNEIIGKYDTNEIISID